MLRSEYYETIVYWPATGYSEHCVLNYTGDLFFAFHTENNRKVNYVVTWHDRQDVARIGALNKTFDRIVNSDVKELYRYVSSQECIEITSNFSNSNPR